MVIILRNRHGHSSFGFEIGRFIVDGILSSKHKSRWRIGNEINKCSLCGKCETVCHRNAIQVNIHNKTWTLNNMRCNQCLSCIMACPKRCLTQVRL